MARTRLRLLTWNIHKAIGGMDRSYRPDRVIAVIAHYQPDIALIQEVDEGVPRSRFHRQVDELGDALDMRHRAFHPNVRLRRGHYGNATLSRWPITVDANLDLTIPPKKRRGALLTRCRVRTGRHSRTVAVFNLHLGLAGIERSMQLRRLLRSPLLAPIHHRTPVVVGGDFNDVWGTLGRRFLEPAGFRRAGHRLNTYPAFLPARPLDALWVRGDVVVRQAFRSRMDLARVASDHLPLVADVEIR